MNSKISFAIIFLFCITFAFTSCKRKQLLLDMKFGLTENQKKEEIDKLVKNKFLTMEVKYDDTTYYRELEINGSTFKCRTYFNADLLNTGMLRNYEYGLSTQSLAETGNDTVSKDGYRKLYSKFIKVSDFENLKSFIDKKYGLGIYFNENFANDTTYKYITDEADIFLTHGKQIYGNYLGFPIKVPIYDIAYIKIRSKTYDLDFAKEKEKRRKELKPADIIWINFEAPFLKSDIDEFGNSVSKIILKVKDEIYRTYVIDDDVIECKGILSIIDSYEDTLKKAELIYVFNTPLKSPIKQELRVENFNTYSISWTDPVFEKISDKIKSGAKLKINFAPSAVVFVDGNLIK